MNRCLKSFIVVILCVVCGHATAQTVKVESNLAHKIWDWSLSCGERYLFTTGPTGVGVWDMDKELFIKNLSGYKGENLVAHPFDDKLLYVDGVLLDWLSGKIVSHIDSPKPRFNSNSFSGVSVKDVLAGTKFGELSETHTRKVLFESIFSFGNNASDKNFSEFADSVVRSFGGNPAMLEESGIEFYRLNDEGDYLIVTPDQYYKVSPGTYGKIHFVKGGIPGFNDRYELRYNRPDIVLDRLGGDPERVAMLRKAWQKRLRRLGMTETAVNSVYSPVAKINNLQSLPISVSDSSMRFEVAFSDMLSVLTEIHITINGVSILNKKTEEISDKKLTKINLTEDVPLAYGKNVVEFSVTNAKGVTSPKASYTVHCVKPEMNKRLFVVSVGVGKYDDDAYDLVYPSKDASDFASLFSASSSDFSDIKVLKIDERFNRESLTEISDFISDVGVDDVVIFFYAGHGVLDDDFNYYLASSDMDFAAPSLRGILFDDFVALLNGSRSLKRYVFIDACHSGVLDKDDIAARTVVVSSKSGGASPAIRFRNTSSLKLASAEVERVNALFESEFSSANDNFGATIVSSASGTEMAAEGSQWENGLFTYCLKEGASVVEETGKRLADLDGNGRLTMTEWLKYASRRVAQLSEGRQTPTTRSLNLQEELEINQSFK